jgi:hypothetical protein
MTLRRTLALVGLAAGALALASPAGALTTPAKWRPWLLSSAHEFRLGPPPSARSAQTKRELRELLRLQRSRTGEQRALVKKWVGQPAVVPWVQEELQLIESYRPRPAPASRDLGILSTAMFDALVAADDSRLAYAKHSRPAPWRLDKRIKPLVKGPKGTSYSPGDAAIAGAAEQVLAYLFPNEPPQTFIGMANEALRARMIAGLNYRSDLQRARALGHKVAQLAIAHAATDGFTNTGFSEGPFTGDQFWTPTPAAYESPLGGPVGTWKPWVVPNYHQFVDVIPPPSPYGSPAFLQQVNDVLDVSAHLTDEQRQIAQFWDDEPGTMTPPGHWNDIALTYIRSYKVSDAQATRIMGYLGALEDDAVITWFGLKYHYWQVRPITAIWRLSADHTHLYTEAQVTADPSLAPLRGVWTPFIPTPPFPSYPAGHPTYSGGSAKLLTYFFPQAGETLNKLAEQVGLSRVYGGIHYPEDSSAGITLGRAIADKFIERAKADGSGG